MNDRDFESFLLTGCFLLVAYFAIVLAVIGAAAWLVVTILKANGVI